MGNYEIFSKRLKELRNDMNLTQKQFAEKVGTTSVTISAYENNAKKPSLEIVKDIAEKCNVSLDWLCGLSDKKNTDDEMTTYADYLKLIIKIVNEKIEIAKVSTKLEIPNNITGDTVHHYGMIEFFDDVVISFFDKWEKMLELYQNGTIDKKLYSLWLDDALKEYENFKIDNQYYITVGGDIREYGKQDD